MKTIIMFFFVTILSLGNDISQKVIQEINRDARTISNDSSERKEYIEWQIDAYKNLHKEVENSKLPTLEKENILFRLKSMYGNNYVKQYSKADEEISNYLNNEMKIETEVKNRLEKNTIVDESKNLESKNNLEKILSTDKVPQQLINRFKSEAERLYPNNFYEQERYISSSIENFKFFKNLK
ncbi:MAG: hypothetical protein ACRC0Y_07990 [Fusobacteriaceae bacterium]